MQHHRRHWGDEKGKPFNKVFSNSYRESGFVFTTRNANTDDTRLHLQRKFLFSLKGLRKGKRALLSEDV